MNNTKEIWKDINGYEGLYQVSSFGRVKSLRRKRYTGGVLKERILNISVNGSGYLAARLYKNGTAKTIRAHKLVCKAFIPNYKNKSQINHIDGNKLNNNVSNLEWCTAKENTAHAIKLGIKNPLTYGNSKLSHESVWEIRHHLKENIYNQTEIGILYGASNATICGINNGRTWKHI